MSEMYCKVENGVVVAVVPRPRWFLDDGVPVSDEFLIGENYYPITSEDPGPGFIERYFSEWVVTPSGVEKTYRQIRDEVPEHNPLTEKAVLNDSRDWIETDQEIIKTYTIVAASEEDVRTVLSLYRVEGRDGDTEAFLEKPASEWIFSDGFIEKTYWEIIEDQSIGLYPDIFYVRELLPFNEWFFTPDTVEKRYTYTARDISDIKYRLIDHVNHIRWLFETGGLAWNHHNIHTDRESHTKILAAFVAASGGDTSDRKWKTYQGFVVLSPAEVIDMSHAVFAFIQECYDAEELIVSDIVNAGTFEGLLHIYETVKEYSWPLNALYHIEV